MTEWLQEIDMTKTKIGNGKGRSKSIDTLFLELDKKITDKIEWSHDIVDDLNREDITEQEGEELALLLSGYVNDLELVTEYIDKWINPLNTILHRINELDDNEK